MEGRFSLGGSFRHKSKVPRSRNSRPLSCDLSDFTSSYFHDPPDALTIPHDTNSESPPPPHEEAILGKEWEQSIGERVCISGVKHGILRYYGRTKFAEGLWCGVELDEPVGKNNGTVNSVQYFLAKPNHGIFAPVSKVSKVKSGWAAELDSLRSPHNLERDAPPPPHKVPEFSLPDQMMLKQSSSDPSFVHQKASTEFTSESTGFGISLGDKRSLTEQRELSRLVKKVRSNTVFYTFSENSGKYKTLPSRPANLEHASSDSSSDDAVYSRTQGSTSNNFSPNTNANLNCDGVASQPARKASYDVALQTAFKTTGIKQSLSFPRTINSASLEPDAENLSHFGDSKNVVCGATPDDPATALNKQHSAADYQNEIFPLNFFLAAEHRDDDDDDQMSLEVDESLGILTPNQMKDFTISADPLNSCTELKTFTFPSSESFDDINDIPEDEQLHDITVEYVGSSHSTPVPQNPLDLHSTRAGVTKDLEQTMNEQLTSANKFLYNYSKKISNSENGLDSKFSVNRIHNFSEAFSNLVKTNEDVSGPDINKARCLIGGQNVDSISNYEVPIVPKTDIKVEPKSPKMLYDPKEITFACEQSNSVFTSFGVEISKIKFDDSGRNLQSLRHLTDDVSIRKFYDTDSSRDSLLQGDHEHAISKEKQLTVSWEDCIERDADGMFTRAERPESVYTVGSNDTGYQEDGEFDAEIGMTTSTESNETGKRFSTLSRDSCLASEDLDKVTESTSTSGYSTGLSDSYCNDRVDDEMLKQTADDHFPETESHHSADDLFHCSKRISTRPIQIRANGSHSMSDNEFAENEHTAYSETASISHDFTSDDTVSCVDNTVVAWTETSTDDTTIEDQVSGDLMETFCAETTTIADSKENNLTRTGKISEADSSQPGSSKEIPKVLSEKTNADDSHSKLFSDKSFLNQPKSKSVHMSVQEGRILEEPVEVPSPKLKCEDERRKQVTKSPRRNVMSKIKAMIEATSCKTMSRNKTAETSEHGDKKAVAPKKSRWEAVTSKIAASLAEEKSKPKAKREIKSKVNTNLSLVRQQRTCKSPRLDSARVSDAEAGSVSSVSSRGLGESKCSSAAAQKHEQRQPADKSRGRSPRSGGKPCMSSRSTSPVAASESSTTVSLTSHNSKNRIGIWKGSTSTIASSIPPPQVKTKPPAHPTPSKGSVSRSVQKTTRRNTEHGSVRMLHHPSPKPVRPRMWLSKAELSQEIKHLGTLCEARTKELNLLKMKLKHATLGFDAFAAVFKYLTEDLDALSHPQLVKELAKTQKLLHQAKNDISCYEKQIEELKSHHAKELAELSEKMLLVYHSELQQVKSKQNEEIGLLEEQHQEKMVSLQSSFLEAAKKAKTEHKKEVDEVRQKFLKQKEEAELLHQSEMKHLEESHHEVQRSLQIEIEQLKVQYAESKQQSKFIEETLQKDTDTKLQWISSKKADLEKEVDSLKAVLEMKNNELHSLRKENLEMQKELEELPIAKEKIKMLQARAEDLQALMAEKVRIERQLLSEHHTMKEVYERESKMNKRLSMENEELQWRISQTSELLLRSQTSSPDVLETPSPPKSPWQQQENSRSKFFTYVDPSECDPESPQAKSPIPVTSRSKFFTFVDPSEYDSQSQHSPRYKRLAPTLSSSPCKQPHLKNPVKLHLASTPRKSKVISEVQSSGATPRKMSKKQSGKCSPIYPLPKNVDETLNTYNNVANIPESMASSVSSEDLALQQGDLEDPIASICTSTNELEECKNADFTSSAYEKSMKPESDISIFGDQATDPKKYYHMTFPVLKETGTDCDVDDGNNYLLVENNENCFLEAKETSDSSEDITRNGYRNSIEETSCKPDDHIHNEVEVCEFTSDKIGNHKMESSVRELVDQMTSGPCENSPKYIISDSSSQAAMNMLHTYSAVENKDSKVANEMEYT